MGRALGVARGVIRGAVRYGRPVPDLDCLAAVTHARAMVGLATARAAAAAALGDIEAAVETALTNPPTQ